MMSDAKADAWGVPTLFALVVAVFLTAIVLESVTALLARAAQRGKE